MGEIELAEPSAASVRTLIDAVQRLSQARTVADVQEIVRHAARELTGADGATFVLREGDNCFYADEDAISPLWKGSRFPLETCISGWAMRNSRPAVIEDIYMDDRIPHDAYRPTFVKSLAMVPIRSRDPIGAIGNYWAEPHLASAEEVDLLQALADSTAVAMENVRVWGELESRVRERTADLRELSERRQHGLHTLAHEVRNPLAAAQMMLEELSGTVPGAADYGLAAEGRKWAGDAHRCIADALRILDEQLELARSEGAEGRAPVAETVSVSELLGVLYAVGLALRESDAVEIVVSGAEDAPTLRTDGHLLTQILRNLLGNALKFTDSGRVELRAAHEPGSGEISFAVADTGIGIPADRLDDVFAEFGQVREAQVGRTPGTGLGLAVSRRLAEALGGGLEAASAPGEGSTFTLTIPLRLPGA